MISSLSGTARIIPRANSHHAAKTLLTLPGAVGVYTYPQNIMITSRHLLVPGLQAGSAGAASGIRKYGDTRHWLTPLAWPFLEACCVGWTFACGQVKEKEMETFPFYGSWHTLIYHISIALHCHFQEEVSLDCPSGWEQVGWFPGCLLAA